MIQKTLDFPLLRGKTSCLVCMKYLYGGVVCIVFLLIYLRNFRMLEVRKILLVRAVYVFTYGGYSSYAEER
jgi:hypothetical protein